MKVTRFLNLDLFMNFIMYLLCTLLQARRSALQCKHVTEEGPFLRGRRRQRLAAGTEPTWGSDGHSRGLKDGGARFESERGTEAEGD